MYEKRDLFPIYVGIFGFGVAFGVIITAIALSTIFFLLLMTWG